MRLSTITIGNFLFGAEVLALGLFDNFASFKSPDLGLIIRQLKIEFFTITRIYVRISLSYIIYATM